MTLTLGLLLRAGLPGLRRLARALGVDVERVRRSIRRRPNEENERAALALAILKKLEKVPE